MFAFSTCWNSDSHIDGEPMLEQIIQLGFKNVELSHGIRLSLLEGIERSMKNHPDLHITSLHNFCPLPVGYIHSAPNIYLLSSSDESERQRAIRQTIVTMDFAVRFQAKFVVLHLGSVPIGHYTRELLDLIREGLRTSPKYQKLLGKALLQREEKGKQPFARAMNSLEVLLQAAEKRNLILGVESRYRIEEIPIESEFEEIFKTFNSPHLGYWHDSGHCQIRQNIGLINHKKWLDQISPHLVGVHLHDANERGRDHLFPGEGSISFNDLTPLRRPEICKTFEFEPGMPSDTLAQHLPQFMKHFELSAS
jgi:sugar phosphate isomerase/epimerase